MKNKLIVLAVAVLLFGAWHLGRAQGPVAATMSGFGPHTTCTTPVAGSYFLCMATDGIWVSNNGAAYFQLLVPVAVAGVTSVQQCNLAGANCGTPQVGTVVLKVPQSVTVSVPLVTSAATAPVITSTAVAPSATLQ